MFDVTDPADLAALKAEVTTDPNGYGYDPDTTYTVTGLINEKRDTITVNKPAISSKSVKNATYYDAYDTLSIDEQEYIRWITEGASESEDLVVTPELKIMLTGVGGTSMWAAAHKATMEPLMLALIEVNGSRAEELFGYGTSISSSDWIAARDS